MESTNQIESSASALPAIIDNTVPFTVPVDTLEDTEATGTNESLTFQANKAAWVTCEASFAVRLAESGLAKGTKEYDTFKREYNAAQRRRDKLVAKGMENPKGTASINYGNPDKHKARQSGGVRPDSALFKVLESLRMDRITAFTNGTKAKETIRGMGLTPTLFAKVAMAIHAVPYSYRVETKSGGKVINMDAALKYASDYDSEMLALKSEAAQAMKEAQDLEIAAAKERERLAALEEEGEECITVPLPVPAKPRNTRNNNRRSD